MKFLRNILDKQAHRFEEGGKLHKFYALYEFVDTFLYTPADVTKNASHIRDGMDLKRLMIVVIVALQPAVLMALYNTGLQINLALAANTELVATGWRAAAVSWVGAGFDPHSIIDNVVHGLVYFVPVFLVTNLVGGFWEVLFASIRKHEINEGFLVTGMIFPLILPSTIPLWEVAIGISFGVVIAKEVFGGTGMNIFNPALVSRAFLFFNFPVQMSGVEVWTAVDGHSAATALGVIAETGMESITTSWWDAFWGFIPGSMGETSTAAILIGAVILIATGVGSWQIMLSIFVSMFLMSGLMNTIQSDTNPMFQMTWDWHLVLGGFAFGAVFMATDPVSASMTSKGKYYYGALIGIMVVLIRVVNPAFPEGMMLAILLGNAFAPLIDNFVIQKNIKRRNARYVV